MVLVTFPDLVCGRCGQAHELSFYSDGSIRSSTHSACPKPVPGPPNPPRLQPQGKFWMVATTCADCGTKGMRVSQMKSAVHMTIVCDACARTKGESNE